MLNLLIDRQHIVMMADNSERIMLGLQKIEKLYILFLLQQHYLQTFSNSFTK
jgi:hypothetical protein